MNVQIASQGNKPSTDPRTDTDIKILCFSIRHLSETAQFILCCVAVLVSFIIYGYLQELMCILDGFKPYGWYLTLVQFVYFTIFALIECACKGTLAFRKIPMRFYFLLAVLTLGTMGFSNASLEYLNYPTQIIFKCCKLIPVMLGGVLIQKKRYAATDYFAAGLMCVGMTWFMLADVEVSPSFNTAGVVMILCALVCDAAIGNVQEKWIKAHRPSNAEVILYSYGIGFVYVFVIMLFSGELLSGIQFCSRHPRETYGYALLYSMSGYVGIQAVLILVQTQGALVTAIVTNCRKAVTIIISFVFFTKPFTMHYVWSSMLVVLGIYLNVNGNSLVGLDVTLHKYVVMMKRFVNGKRTAAANNLKYPVGGE